MTFTRQVWTLTVKSLRLAWLRRPITTTIRAFIFPLTLVLIVAYAQYFLNPPQHFGIGPASPVLSIQDALARSNAARDTIVFVDNGLTGGNISALIDRLSTPFREAGKNFFVLSNETQLLTTCRSSLRGTSSCLAAVVFHSSPNEPPGASAWNYTLRADVALGGVIDVTSASNDPQIYVMPLQHEIDRSIALLSGRRLPEAFDHVQQYPFTVDTEDERVSNTRASYIQRAVANFIILFFLAMVGVVYQLTGFVAAEREHGLSQLIDAMLPNRARWQPQVARLLSHHLAFSLLYFPSWLATGAVMTGVIFTRSNAAIAIFYHITAGLALTSYALLGAAFFHKAQLSGIAVAIIAVVLAVVPQVLPDANQTQTTVVSLSLLFPSANYVYFVSYMARWELNKLPTDLFAGAPDSPWSLPGIVLWVLLALQALLYPILALTVERLLYGTTSKDRVIVGPAGPHEPTVALQAFGKTYLPTWLERLFKRSKTAVRAVQDLSLEAQRGEILMLLGRNGSGKSTTLDAIAGLSPPSHGRIQVDGSGGLGLVPQKNVLWDDLTVTEHVAIFDRLKSSGIASSADELRGLIAACDLSAKAGALAKTLSGGQKRKLQLAMMFAGGSAVCCIDEVSSGLDPLSRRKIWDILLAQRRDRTIIMTTHFLDEADFLSDRIALLSHGQLKAQGSAVCLKSRYGGGYRFTVPRQPASRSLPRVQGIQRADSWQQSVYSSPDAAGNGHLIEALDAAGIDDYEVAGPSLEDAFLELTQESLGPESAPEHLFPATESGAEKMEVLETIIGDGPGRPARLHDGRPVGVGRQGWLLFQKRLRILRRNYLPHVSAILIALIGAGVSPMLLQYYNVVPCSVLDQSPDDAWSGEGASLSMTWDLDLVAGPHVQTFNDSLTAAAELYSAAYTAYNLSQIDSVGSWMDNVHSVDTLGQFNDYVAREHTRLNPGGLYLGGPSEPATFAWLDSQQTFYDGVIMQNLLDCVLSNVSIATQYAPFSVPSRPVLFDFSALVFVAYFGLIMVCYPALFALYPTVERLRKVRALHYSNGVRPLPLWTAYLAFDAVWVLAISALSIALVGVTSHVWYELIYLFVVLTLYGIASTLLGYLFSLMARSALALWAACAGFQAVMFFAYLGAYLGVQASVETASLISTFTTVHFTLGLLSPVANLTRALFISLRFFTLTCGIEDSPGSMQLYGGPILYLIGQSVVYFVLLIWSEGGWSFGRGRRSAAAAHGRKAQAGNDGPEDVAHGDGAHAGLTVSHLSKAFGSKTAVDDVSFEVQPGEIFALLGPNGAGKSTTISLIRGDLRPSDQHGQIMVGEHSMLTQRAAARASLGVCPQFDAADVLTVEEHLYFYARVRGVEQPRHNVDEVMRAFGLEDYRRRLAYKLSGGTKRKLSLAIALIGNPEVLLLDEPSTGMDATSKRAMWRALASLALDRSVVLTTHSMEEADVLAGRAGIMSGRFLALDSCDRLRRRWGNVYHVHLVARTAPHSEPAEMEALKAWLCANLHGAEVEARTYCGQIRLTVPAQATATTADGRASGIGPVLRLLERSKERVGVQSYSIGHTTLDQVFVNIVRQHGGEEEEGNARRWWQRR